MEINLTTLSQAMVDPGLLANLGGALAKAPLTLDGDELDQIEIRCDSKSTKKKKCMPVCACGAGYFAQR